MKIIKLIRLFIFVFILTALMSPMVSSAQGVLPYADAVKEILKPLQYSGLGRFLEKNSNITIDFDKKIWILHNALHFDDSGFDVLSEGNSGLCGQLSRYVYFKIKNVFPEDRYRIMFEKVREKNYFFAPQASHFVITIQDLGNDKKYLIDPSFKRYGAVEDLDEYQYIEVQNPESFIQSNKSPDKFFFIDSASPIMIRGDKLLVFSVESVDGKIDRNHFVLAISAVKQQASLGEYVLGLKYIDGYLQTYSNGELMRELLKPEEIANLQQRMFQWSVAISGN